MLGGLVITVTLSLAFRELRNKFWPFRQYTCKKLQLYKLPMNETSTGSIFSKIVIAIFFFAVLDLIFLNWWVLKKSESPAHIISYESTPSINNETTKIDGNLENVPVKNEAASPSPTPVPSPPPAATGNSSSGSVIVQTQYKEIFIPMGSGSTKSQTYSDLYGAEVTIDTTKYSTIESITFEASIWAEGGNGRAWAQIKNITDNNPLIESQISGSFATPTLKTSGRIPVPSGTKTYRVQAKTDITDFYAHVDDARLKIVLK